MRWPKVSVITINYNSISSTVEFLESIYNISYPDYEVILVDNDSKEFNQEQLQNDFPDLKIVRNKENYGFAKGNNIGMEYATGAYYAFLNNDTIVDKGFLEPVVQEMENNSSIAIASPKVLYWSDKKIQFAGADQLGYFTGRGKVKGRGCIDDGSYDACYETSVIHGGAMVVPKRVVEDIGKIPEDYFLYYEELDWGKRAIDKGYVLMYVGHSKVYDKVSQSIGQNSTLKTYYLNRSRILYTRLNSKGLQKALWFFVYFGFSVPRDILKFLFQKKNNHIIALVKAISWNLKYNAGKTSRNKERDQE